MADQTQIQSGETFVSDVGPFRKVTREGQTLNYFDANDKLVSTTDLASNPAAGVLSNQYKLYDPNAGTSSVVNNNINRPFETGVQEVQRLGGGSYEQAYDFSKKLTTQNQAERTASITQLTANREAQGAPQANIINADGGPVVDKNPLSSDPNAVNRNTGFAPIGELGDPFQSPDNFKKINTPEELAGLQSQLMEAFGITADEFEENFLFRADQVIDGDSRIFIRKDALDQLSKSLATGPIVVNEFETMVGADGDGGSVLPSDLLADAFADPKTGADLQALLEQNGALQQAIMAALAPSEKELALEQEIADVAEQAQNLLLSAELGIQEISEQPIAMPFIIGQAKNVEQRAQLKLQALQNQETNLLSRLGIEQKNRMIQLDQANAQLQFNNQNIQLMFQIQDRIRAEEDRIFNRTMALRNDAKGVLGTILQNFEGMDFEDLDGAAQSKLAQLANDAGVPIDLLVAGMANVKNNMMAENLKAEADQQQSLLQSLALDVAAKGGDPGVVDFSKSFEENLQTAYKQFNVGTGPGGFGYNLTDDQQSTLFKIRSEAIKDPQIQDFLDVQSAYGRVVAASQNPSAAGDLAMIFNYMKMLDPASVVREGEFANAQNAAGVPERIRAQYNRIKDGERLTEETRADFVFQAQQLFNSQSQIANNAAEFYRQTADAFGVPRELVLRELTDPTQRTEEFTVAGFIQSAMTLPDYNPTETLDFIYEQFPQAQGAIEMARQVPGATPEKILDSIQRAYANPSFELNNIVSGGGMSFIPTANAMELGDLSAPYESGNDPGRVSSGAGDPGGQSYGLFQLTTGNVPAFIAASPYAPLFQGLAAGTAAFNQAWQALAKSDPAGFAQEQYNYIKQTHFDPQVQKIVRNGIDLSPYSDVLADVIWSTSVQHGPANSIIVNAFKALGNNPDEESLIKKIYEYRWGGGQNFRSSSQAVRDGVYNRFFGSGGEMATALGMLASKTANFFKNIL